VDAPGSDSSAGDSSTAAPDKNQTAAQRQGWLAVGKIRRPHGIHGELTVEPVTDFPERMVAGVEIGLGINGPDQLMTVHTVRWHKGAWLLGLAGIQERDSVERFRDLWVFLPAQERAALPENYYYEHELVGCRCLDVDGHDLGTVTALVDGGGGALLEVATSGGTVQVPFVSPIVTGVELSSRVVTLDPPRGLFDDDAL
jgi:16S rRNA processing protein RimM